MSDKMDIDKVFRYGDDSFYQLDYIYDRSMIKDITPISKIELLEMIDVKYKNGVNKYLKAFNNLDEYVLWRNSPNTWKEIHKKRMLYLKKKLQIIN